MPSAVYRIGGSASVLDSASFARRSAYLVVGVAGEGSGSGIERYKGGDFGSDGDPDAWIKLPLTIFEGRPYVHSESSLTATMGESAAHVELDWSAPAGTSGFEILRDGESIADNATAPYLDTEAEPGVEHRYRIRMTTGSGDPGISEAATGKRAPPPEAVDELAASRGTHADSIELTWSAVEGAEGYRIEREGETIETVTEPGFQDTEPAPGEEVSYRVFAANAAGEAAGSESASGYIAETPVDPEGLTATEGEYLDRVELTWGAVENAESYRVYRDEELIGTTSDTGLTDDGVEPGTRHDYRVQAENVAGTSSGATTVGYALAPPPTPEGLGASTNRQDGVRLTWEESLDAERYTIYADGEPIAEVTETQHLDTALDMGEGQEYEVTASNRAGESARSTPAEGIRADSAAIPEGARLELRHRM